MNVINVQTDVIRQSLCHTQKYSGPGYSVMNNKGNSLHPVSNCYGCETLNAKYQANFDKTILSNVGMDVNFVIKLNSLQYVQKEFRDKFYSMLFSTNEYILDVDCLSKFPFQWLMDEMCKLSRTEEFFKSCGFADQKGFDELYTAVKALIQLRNMTTFDLNYSEEGITENYRKQLLSACAIPHKELVVQFRESSLYVLLIKAKDDDVER